MYLDVKSFKGFNAAFGYATGDRVLLDLNGTLAGMKAADERYAHVIADEFVLLVRWRGWDALLEHFDELDRRFNSTETLTELSHRLMLQAGVCIIERSAETPRIDVQPSSSSWTPHATPGTALGRPRAAPQHYTRRA